MTTDAELLQRYTSAGAEDAFAELVRRHITLVYSTALRQLGDDSHLAQDVTQRVFAALARKGHALTDRAALAGWLYLAAHHAAVEFVRANSRRKIREQEAHAMQELTAVSAAEDWARVRPLLDAAMRDLSETDREAVLLRFFEQQSYADVGAALNLSVDAARMRVDRAIEKLRGLLGRRGITSTGAALGAALANQAIALPVDLIASVTGAALRHGGPNLGAGTTEAGAFSIMNLPTLAISTIALIAIGGAVYQAREARRAESATQTAAQQVSVLRAQLHSIERDLASTREQLAAVQSRVAPAAPAFGMAPPRQAAAAAPGSGSGAVARWGFRSSDGTLQESTSFIDTPEGRRAMLYEAAESTYAAFFRQQAWTGQQKETFKALMADRKELGRQLLQGALAGGTPPTREMALKVTDQTTRDFEVRMGAALGDGAVEALRDFETKKPLRNLADNLAKKLFYTDAPLSPAQADQLVAALAKSVQSAEGRIDLNAVGGESLIAPALAVLSPTQVDAFRELEAQRLKQREIEQQAMAERVNAGRNQTPTR
jgi:RNA polymerase sigma factor (sigma-70 family)